MSVSRVGCHRCGRWNLTAARLAFATRAPLEHAAWWLQVACSAPRITLTLWSSCPTCQGVPGVMGLWQRQQWAWPAATRGRSAAFAALCSGEAYLARRAASAGVCRFLRQPLAIEGASPAYPAALETRGEVVEGFTDLVEGEDRNCRHGPHRLVRRRKPPWSTAAHGFRACVVSGKRSVTHPPWACKHCLRRVADGSAAPHVVNRRRRGRNPRGEAGATPLGATRVMRSALPRPSHKRRYSLVGSHPGHHTGNPRSPNGR